MAYNILNLDLPKYRIRGMEYVGKHICISSGLSVTHVLVINYVVIRGGSVIWIKNPKTRFWVKLIPIQIRVYIQLCQTLLHVAKRKDILIDPLYLIISLKIVPLSLLIL